MPFKKEEFQKIAQEFLSKATPVEKLQTLENQLVKMIAAAQREDKIRDLMSALGGDIPKDCRVNFGKSVELDFLGYALLQVSSLTLISKLKTVFDEQIIDSGWFKKGRAQPLYERYASAFQFIELAKKFLESKKSSGTDEKSTDTTSIEKELVQFISQLTQSEWDSVAEALQLEYTVGKSYAHALLTSSSPTLFLALLQLCDKVRLESTQRPDYVGILKAAKESFHGEFTPSQEAHYTKLSRSLMEKNLPPREVGFLDQLSQLKKTIDNNFNKGFHGEEKTATFEETTFIRLASSLSSSKDLTQAELQLLQMITDCHKNKKTADLKKALMTSVQDPLLSATPVSLAHKLLSETHNFILFFEVCALMDTPSAPVTQLIKDKQLEPAARLMNLAKKYLIENDNVQTSQAVSLSIVTLLKERTHIEGKVFEGVLRMLHFQGGKETSLFYALLEKSNADLFLQLLHTADDLCLVLDMGTVLQNAALKGLDTHPEYLHVRDSLWARSRRVEGEKQTSALLNGIQRAGAAARVVSDIAETVAATAAPVLEAGHNATVTTVAAAPVVLNTTKNLVGGVGTGAVITGQVAQLAYQQTVYTAPHILNAAQQALSVAASAATATVSAAENFANVISDTLFPPTPQQQTPPAQEVSGHKPPPPPVQPRPTNNTPSPALGEEKRPAVSSTDNTGSTTSCGVPASSNSSSSASTTSTSGSLSTSNLSSPTDTPASASTTNDAKRDQKNLALEQQVRQQQPTPSPAPSQQEKQPQEEPAQRDKIIIIDEPESLGKRAKKAIGNHLNRNRNKWRWFFGLCAAGLVLALCFSPLGPIVFAGLPLIGTALLAAAQWTASCVGGYFAAAGVAVAAGFIVGNLERVIFPVIFFAIELGKFLTAALSGFFNAPADYVWQNIKRMPWKNPLKILGGIFLAVLTLPAFIMGVMADLFEKSRQIQIIHDVVMLFWSGRRAPEKQVKFNDEKYRVKTYSDVMGDNLQKPGQPSFFGMFSHNAKCYLRETVTEDTHENLRGLRS